MVVGVARCVTIAKKKKSARWLMSALFFCRVTCLEPENDIGRIGPISRRPICATLLRHPFMASHFRRRPISRLKQPLHCSSLSRVSE